MIFNDRFPVELLLIILEGYFQSIQRYYFDQYWIGFPQATLIQPPPLHPYTTVHHRLCKTVPLPIPHRHSFLVISHRTIPRTNFLLTGAQVNRLSPAHTLNERPHPAASRSFQSRDCSLHSLLRP